MLPGGPKSAICVQKFDDSLISAIHITYRSWLRSSSMHEPRDPPLKVVKCFLVLAAPFPNTQLRIHRKETSFVSITWFTLGHLWFVGTHALLNKEKKARIHLPLLNPVTLPPKRERQTRKEARFCIKRLTQFTQWVGIFVFWIW